MICDDYVIDFEVVEFVVIFYCVLEIEEKGKDGDVKVDLGNLKEEVVDEISDLVIYFC